jgi:OOP family OmpA-OmpF porin
VLGVRGAGPIGHRLLWFSDVTLARFPTDMAPGDAERVAIRAGIDYLLSPEAHRSWSFSGAAGWGEVDFESATLDFDRPLASVGVGQRVQMANSVLFRWELRVEAMLGSSGLFGDSVQNVEALVGWALPIGRSGHDADSDGIPDRKDRCAFTPVGAVVDERGCAVDSDGDGVPDGLDRCPSSPAGARVNADGCPNDFDRDGVPDVLDRCPRTTPGAKVDEMGCELDSDRDGISDGLDACPDTPPGFAVDARGCPVPGR